MDLFRLLSFRYAPHRSWNALAALPVMGLLLALAGPFGSYLNMPFWSRCGHFVFCFTLIGFLVLEGTYRLARRYFMGHWPVWAALLFDLALVVPAALIVNASLQAFDPSAINDIRFLELVWQNLLIILTVQAGIVAAAVAEQARLQRVELASATSNNYPLAHRLPFALKRSAVLALTSEDHYLRVHTLRGEALIHMTLTEAIELLKGGFQIHRSHWIHDGAVKDYRDGHIELTTGLRLPLSRHRRKDFEAWLGRKGLEDSLAQQSDDAPK
jgi:hypothetical protein